ncbi:hypothetical protein NQZ68_013758 [Dissostichus eleginoides]|nr:hypothetical protein NQZ68_013758 [Dissostichus eleginoides]
MLRLQPYDRVKKSLWAQLPAAGVIGPNVKGDNLAEWKRGRQTEMGAKLTQLGRKLFHYQLHLADVWSQGSKMDVD